MKVNCSKTDIWLKNINIRRLTFDLSVFQPFNDDFNAPPMSLKMTQFPGDRTAVRNRAMHTKRLKLRLPVKIQVKD